MSFLVVLLLYDISRRLGVAIVVFMAIKNAEQLFQVVGGEVPGLLAQAGMTRPVFPSARSASTSCSRGLSR